MDPRPRPAEASDPTTPEPSASQSGSSIAETETETETEHDAVGLPDFAEAVLGVVDQIPAGMVLSYGDVSELLGLGGPRQVGSVMSRYGASVPWWRVTRSGGEAPQGLLDDALAHWRAEGTALVGGATDGRRVDMRRARWDGIRA